MENEDFSEHEDFSLRYKLRTAQCVLYDSFYATNEMVVYLLAHRGLGKSFFCCVIALETAIRVPFADVRLVAPTLKMARTINGRLIQRISRDLPEEMCPKFKAADSIFEFANGSQIILGGTDGVNTDAARGPGATLTIIDEAGFAKDLEYYIHSVILPRASIESGRVLIPSSPPASASHPFAKLLKNALKEGLVHKIPVDDNPDITKEMKNNLAKNVGGFESSAYRREFGCEIVTEDSRAVFFRLLHKLRTSSLEGSSSLFEKEKENIVSLGAPVVVGFDFSFTNEFRAVAVAVRPDGCFVVIHEFMHELSDVSHHNFMDRIQETVGDYIATTDGTEQFITELRRVTGRGIRKTVFKDKFGVSRLSDIVSNNKLAFQDGKHFVTEEHLPNAIWDEDMKDFDMSDDGTKFGLVRALCYAVDCDFGAWDVRSEYRQNLEAKRHWLGAVEGVRVFDDRYGEVYDA